MGGVHIPSFTVRTIGGDSVRYRTDIWQRQHLVLARLGGDGAAEQSWMEALEAARPAIEAADARLVITRDPVDDVPAPSVLVADRWGEVQRSFEGALPEVGDLVEWVEWVSQKCPECEAEAR